jgi:O-antigen/teichoic acid export membrane protein
MISSLRGLVRRRTVRATLTNSAVNACVLCLNLATGLLTARLLGPEGRGAYTAMVIWPQFLASLFTLGLQQAVPYNLVRRPEERAAITAAALLLSLGAGSAAALIGSVLVPLWLGHYGPEILAMARVILWLAPVVLLIWTCNACMQAAGRFDLFNRSQYLQPVLSLLGLLTLTALGLLTPVSAALTSVAGALPVLALGLAWLWREHRPELARPLAECLRLLRYGLRSCGVQLVNALWQQFDNVFVLGALSPATVGLYVVARNAARPSQFFASAMNAVLFPRASALTDQAALELSGLAARVGIVAALAVALPLGLLGPWLITALYGADFAAAALPFQILVAEAAVAAISSTMAQAFLSVGRPGVVTVLQVASFLAGATMIVLLVPRLGIQGAALGLLAGSLVRLVVIAASYPAVLRVTVPRLWLNGADLQRLFAARRMAAA